MNKNPDYSQTTIYQIKPSNPDLNYCYIGHTTNIEIRQKQHKSTCYNIHL